MCQKAKRFLFYFLVLGLLGFPTSSFATYFSGPPEIISSLQFNSLGQVVFDPQSFSRNSFLAQAEPAANPPEIDPYSDEAIEEDDPFDVNPENTSDIDEDPFADEEKNIPPMSDPMENWFNRPMYAFNDGLYEYLMRPVAETYRDVVGEGYRLMLRNLSDTVTSPGRLVSSLLQFDFEKAGRVLSRVVINCTLGFLCMADVAKEAHDIQPVDEDFAQVLGFYGIGSGPYLVLPVFGPSSVRDGVGRFADALMSPLWWLVPDFGTGAAITTGRIINETSFFIEDIEALKESSIDPYISIRDFYNQRREILIDE